MEKAFAGVDQTWVPVRRADWAAEWAGLCAQDRADGVQKPRSGPPATGYVRLHQGTTPWERAEALTQLTGQPAVVRQFAEGRDEWTINRDIRTQLTEGQAGPGQLPAELDGVVLASPVPLSRHRRSGRRV
jgi:hypothetical protein